ncbi:hypothetical protein SAMN05216275_113104 [Streptosporangium canum]|uniref:Uncharacterized protein n=2 Tax=Streptosporangium canum TaxID=324952 RepID=A0A1I3UXS2_9ACTN|nr:hypothetical protein SAMN05216275_113104 [Streptosporangium canum]
MIAGMTKWIGRWAGCAAIGWTLLYLASKAHFALEERIGVTGGPQVTADAYRDYGPGEVAQAQWANAAAGALIVLLLLVSLTSVRRLLPRWILLALLWTCAAMAAAGAIGMLGGAMLTDRGGAVFGGYCAVWAVLLIVATLDFHRRSRA